MKEETIEDKVTNLLFKVYERGVEMNDTDLTYYFDQIKSELRQEVIQEIKDGLPSDREIKDVFLKPKQGSMVGKISKVQGAKWLKQQILNNIK